MKLAIFALGAVVALVLGGCASTPYAGPPAVDFSPTGHVTYAADLKECTAEVVAIKQHLDLTTVGNNALVAAAQGAAVEAPAAAINPLIVAVNAVVQGFTSLLSGFDAQIRFLPTQHNYRIDRCMDTRAARNREYTPVN